MQVTKMKRLRLLVLRLAALLGLYDDGVTPLQKKRAKWDAEVDGAHLKPLRKKESRR